MSRRLVKRMQRAMWGGTVYVRFYDDGSARLRTDHPSNDAAFEIQMAGAALGILFDAYETAGFPRPVIGPVAWRDDPTP